MPVLNKKNMFQEHLALITKSNTEVTEVESTYDDKKVELTIKVQKLIEKELTKIKSEDTLKNYSPIEHHNLMTQYVREFKQLESEKKSKIAEIKKTLDLALYELVGKPEVKPPITEMYKVISSANDNANYACRVWFTLVPIKEWECKPGDIIRIEWFNSNSNRLNDTQSGITSTYKRTGKGESGIKIPQFINQGRITNINTFYQINIWGAQSSQRNWWLEWVKINRPIPE